MSHLLSSCSQVRGIKVKIKINSKYLSHTAPAPRHVLSHTAPAPRYILCVLTRLRADHATPCVCLRACVLVCVCVCVCVCV